MTAAGAGALLDVFVFGYILLKVNPSSCYLLHRSQCVALHMCTTCGKSHACSTCCMVASGKQCGRSYTNCIASRDIALIAAGLLLSLAFSTPRVLVCYLRAVSCCLKCSTPVS